MKIKLSKIVSCTLVCTGVFSAIGAGMYARTQASDSDLDVSLSAVTPTAASCQAFLVNHDARGGQLALLQDGREVVYSNALCGIVTRRNLLGAVGKELERQLQLV